MSTDAALAPAQVGRQMTIIDLRIHPIKSCRGISLKSSRLTRRGLEYDRKWMFVDAANSFLTIRSRPEMTLIKTAIDHDTGDLKITLPARSHANETETASFKETTIRVPLEPTESWLKANCDLLSVEIWEFGTDGWTYSSPAISGPVSEFFRSLHPDLDAKLVMKGPTARPLFGNGDYAHLGRHESVNFADMLPLQVASAASLAELNGRLHERGVEPITVERFRPNIVVDGPELVPWEEDEWKLLRINPPTSVLGSVVTAATSSLPVGWNASVLGGHGLSQSIDVDVACRCARCQVPNVDPDTAFKHPKEPWTLLVSYRRVDEGIKWKPCFGMLCCPRGEGRVEVGMTVEVREVMAAAGGTGKHKFATE